MVIAEIGNPIIPDTSDASRAQYEQLKKLSDEYGVDVTLFPAYNRYPAVADRLDALYQKARETAPCVL